MLIAASVFAITFQLSGTFDADTVGSEARAVQSSVAGENWPRPQATAATKEVRWPPVAIAVALTLLAGAGIGVVCHVWLSQLAGRLAGERATLSEHLEKQSRQFEAKLQRYEEIGQTLRESEQRFRAIVEGSNHGIIVHRDGSPLFANPAMAKLLGYDSPDDLLCLVSIADFVFEDDVVQVRNLWTRRMRGEKMPDVVAYRMQRKDESVISVEVRATTIDWAGAPAVLAACYDTTEQKSGEYAVRENAVRLRRLLQTIPYGIQEFNVEGTITFSNPAHAAMLGYEEDDLIGRKIWDLEATDETREALKAYFAAMVEQQPDPEPYFSEVVTKSGEKIHIRIDWTYVRSPTDHLLGFSSIITDITESEKTRQSLERSEEHFRTLAEASVEGITVIQDNRFVFVNPAAAHMLGYGSPDDLLSIQTVDLIIHPAAREEIRGRRQARLNGEVVPTNYELRLLSADNRTVWMENKVKMIVWDGRPAVFSIYNPITKRNVEDAVVDLAEETV